MFGNPHEMPLTGIVESIQRHAVPESKDWFAYTTKIPAAVRAHCAIRCARGRVCPSSPRTCIWRPGRLRALAIALRATVDPGDEVIFISPPWFFYESMIA